MGVVFRDFSVQIKAAVNSTSLVWLNETGNEIASQAQSNCTMDGEEGTQLRGSYQSKVSGARAQVGSPLESACWEEYGTGEFAANGNGRPGWWVYVEGMNKHSAKTRSEENAQEVAESMRADGFPAHATNGRPPSYTLENAFKIVIPKAEKELARRLKEL